MSIQVAGTTFDHHHYDERGDVLYLNAGDCEGPPAQALATPEGHGIEYDEAGRVVRLTLTNVRWYIERDGELTITWPAGRVSPSELAEALQSTA